MLTEGHWLIVHIKLEKFSLWIPLPLYILSELLWQVLEVMELVGGLGFKKVKEFGEALEAMPFVIDAVSCFGEGGRYDLVDIDVKDEDGSKVRVYVKVR